MGNGVWRRVLIFSSFPPLVKRRLDTCGLLGRERERGRGKPFELNARVMH